MRNTLILAALLAAAPFAASAADGLSYTYVEGGYSHLKLHSSELDDPSVDGAYVRGSYAVSPQLYVFGGYTQLSRTDHADLGGNHDDDAEPDRVEAKLDDQRQDHGHRQDQDRDLVHEEAEDDVAQQYETHDEHGRHVQQQWRQRTISSGLS